MLHTITVASPQITLPSEALLKLKGKDVQLIEFQDGFILKPVSFNIKNARGFLKKYRFSTDRYFEMKQEKKGRER